jgi:hypothetical protein
MAGNVEVVAELVEQVVHRAGVYRHLVHDDLAGRLVDADEIGHARRVFCEFLVHVGHVSISW